MIVQHESRTTKLSRQQELSPPLENDLLRKMTDLFPEQVEEEMSDHYWGTSDAYHETYFNIPPGD